MKLQNKQKLVKRTVLNEDAIDWVHGGLDILGLIPGIGEGFDLANAALYAKDGDWLNTALSLISVIPGIGDVFGKGGKIAVYLEKMVIKGGNSGKLAAKIMTSAPKVIEIVKSGAKLYKDHKSDIQQFLTSLSTVDNEKVQQHIVPHIKNVENALKVVERAFDTFYKEEAKAKSSSTKKPSSPAVQDAVSTMEKDAAIGKSEAQDIFTDASREVLQEQRLKNELVKYIKESIHNNKRLTK